MHAGPFLWNDTRTRRLLSAARLCGLRHEMAWNCVCARRLLVPRSRLPRDKRPHGKWRRRHVWGRGGGEGREGWIAKGCARGSSVSAATAAAATLTQQVLPEPSVSAAAAAAAGGGVKHRPGTARVDTSTCHDTHADGTRDAPHLQWPNAAVGTPHPGASRLPAPAPQTASARGSPARRGRSRTGCSARHRAVSSCRFQYAVPGVNKRMSDRQRMSDRYRV